MNFTGQGLIFLIVSFVIIYGLAAFMIFYYSKKYRKVKTIMNQPEEGDSNDQQDLA